MGWIKKKKLSYSETTVYRTLVQPLLIQENFIVAFIFTNIAITSNRCGIITISTFNLKQLTYMSKHFSIIKATEYIYMNV